MNTFTGVGQINMNTQFGEYICKIASLNDVVNIFEVGTWNGQGSTVCLMNGIINKTNSNLYSIEANPQMYNQAISFWKEKNTKINFF